MLGFHDNRSPLLSQESPPTFRTLRLIGIVSVVSIGSSLQLGFGTATLNNLDMIISSSLATAGPVSLVQWSWIMSGFAIGGLLGSALGATVLCQYFGRKKVLLLTNWLVLVSSAFLAAGGTWYSLLIGRICAGAVAGIVAVVTPMYFAEIAPTKWRGAVGMAHQFGIAVGIVVAQLLTTPSLHLLGSMSLWRYVFAVPVLCALLECTVLPFCPESPVYLFKTEGSSAALTKLAQLHAAGSVSSHMSSMRGEAADYMHIEVPIPS